MWGASERYKKPGDVLSLGGTVQYRIFRYAATLKDQLQGTNCLSHGGNTETLCSLFECHLFQLINLVQVFRVRISWIIRRPNLNKIMMWYQSMRIQANLQVRRILHNGHDVAVRLIPVGLREAASRKNQCNSAVASGDTLKNGVLTACHNNDDNTVKAPGSFSAVSFAVWAVLLSRLPPSSAYMANKCLPLSWHLTSPACTHSFEAASIYPICLVWVPLSESNANNAK